MSRRHRLPNRRRCEFIDTQFRGRKYTIVVNRFTNGKIGEIFIEPTKTGTDLSEDSRDSAIIVSVALQFRTPLEALLDTVLANNGGAR